MRGFRHTFPLPARETFLSHQSFRQGQGCRVWLIRSLGDLWVVFPSLNLAIRPWPGLPSKEYYSFCQGGAEWDSLGGGVLPKLSAFRTPPHPCPLLEASQGDLQKLTRDASLQLDVQPEQQAHLGGCPQGHSYHTGLSSQNTGNALLFPATLLAPKRKPVYWGIHFFSPKT